MKSIELTRDGAHAVDLDISVTPPQGVYVRRRLCLGWYLFTLTNPQRDQLWTNVVARDLLKLYCGVGPSSIVVGPAWIVAFEEDNHVDCTAYNVDMWSYVVRLLMED